MYPEYLEYTDPDQVRFQVKDDIPWNCFYPRLVAKGSRMKFSAGSSPLITYAQNPLDIQSDKVQLKLSCSSIEYSVKEFTVARDHDDVCMSLDEDTTLL